MIEVDTGDRFVITKWLGLLIDGHWGVRIGRGLCDFILLSAWPFFFPLNAHNESSSGSTLMGAESTLTMTDWWIRIMAGCLSVSFNILSSTVPLDVASLTSEVINYDDWALIYHRIEQRKKIFCITWFFIQWDYVAIVTLPLNRSLNACFT